VEIMRAHPALALVRGLISPGKRRFEERTFECSTCARIEEIFIAVNLKRTDAVNWLAGELRPLQW
jgi:hypothetical protein